VYTVHIINVEILKSIIRNSILFVQQCNKCFRRPTLLPTDYRRPISVYLQMKRLVQNLYIRDNCHPLKDFVLPWIQIPMWISMSLALRTMAGSISVGGVGRYVYCEFQNITYIYGGNETVCSLALTNSHNVGNMPISNNMN